MERDTNEVRELMAEGDRMLGRAWEHSPSSKAGVTTANVELAEYYYTQAAQAYLVGAVEYQRGRAVADDGSALTDTDDLVRSLEGHLRTEADGAVRTAERVGRDSAHSGVEHARVLAEELRDRFAHTEPELFGGATDVGIERTSQPSRSR